MLLWPPQTPRRVQHQHPHPSHHCPGAYDGGECQSKSIQGRGLGTRGKRLQTVSACQCAPNGQMQARRVGREGCMDKKTIRPVLPTSLAIPWRCQMAAGSGVWPQDTKNPSHHTPPPGRGSAKPQRRRGLVLPPARVDQSQVRPGAGLGLQQGCRRPPLHHQPRSQACGAHLGRTEDDRWEQMGTKGRRKREATQSQNAKSPPCPPPVPHLPPPSTHS